MKHSWASFLDNNGPEFLTEAITDNTDRIAVAVINDARRWPRYSHADIAYQSSQLERYLSGSIDWLKEQWGDDTGVNSLAVSNLSISIQGNVVTVNGQQNLNLPLTTIDGNTRLLNIQPGDNIFTLSPGLYILAGRKLLIHQ